MYFCFIIAYAQGLNLLARASVEYKMDIPLKDVVNVWKAGCIIRSSLLYEFDKAFLGEAQSNILLDEHVAILLKGKGKSVRRLISVAVACKVPVAGMSSAIAYFDAFCSGRMPTNLIQAQRDFSGAHAYRRLDREGVFHTEWNVEWRC